MAGRLYRPKAVTKKAVIANLERGRLVRSLELRRVAEGVLCPPVRELPGEPCIIAQPFELLPPPGTYPGSLWLWVDGSLRSAPQFVVAGSPYDREWPLDAK